jgi:hypothetical protein
VFQHCAICWVNAYGAQCKINCAINVAHGVRRNHFALNDGEDPNVERAAVLLRPWFKWNFNAEQPEIRVKKIIDLINPCPTTNRVKRASQLC